MSFQYTTRIPDASEDIVIIHLNGRLIDQTIALQMLEEVQDLILDGHKFFILNLSKLDHMNSSGLNTLVNLLTKSRNDGGETMLCNVSKNVENLFIMTKLNTVFNITENEQEAITQMQAFMQAEQQDQ